MEYELKSIIKEITEFRDERDWRKFHNAKDLAISLNLEAGELLECFQWKTSDEVESENRVQLEDEIGDVAIYLLLLCNETNIDVLKAISNKLNKNKIKYPIDKCKGVSTKYNKL